MALEEHAYLAGILDGEGWIKIYRHHRNGRNTFFLRVGAVSTDRILIAWLKERYGGYIHLKKQRGNRRPTWEWHASSTREQLRLELMAARR